MKIGVIYHNPSLPLHVNIGDDIQTLGVINLLQEICGKKLEIIYIDREHVNDFLAPEPVITIMQGWWLHNLTSWPPSPSIKPIFIGFHVSSKFRKFIARNPDSLQYFKLHEPIGCRDLASYNFFISKGVKAYFSGCLSIFQSPKNDSLNRDTVFLVDAAEMASFLPSSVTNNIICLSHQIGFSSLGERLIAAQKLIDLYFSRGKLVITTKLHCALPCIAMGLPVIVLRHKRIDDRLDLLRLFTKNIYFYPLYLKLINILGFGKKMSSQRLHNVFQVDAPESFLYESQQKIRTLLTKELRKNFRDIDFS